MYSEDLKEPFLPRRDCESYGDAAVEDLVSGSTDHEGLPLDIRSQPKSRRIRKITLGLLVLSLLGNILLLYKIVELRSAPDLGRSKFSSDLGLFVSCDTFADVTSGGLGYDHPVEYRVHTDYGGSNSTLADQLWEAIDSSPIIVALTDEYATAHDLEISVRFPWDDTKGIYHVKAFHHLHCLVGSCHLILVSLANILRKQKSFRKAYTDMRLGNSQIVPTDHVYHCLDTLRQDVMCLADDTPMPTSNAIHHIGNGQIRQCRNWDKLVAWTQEPERHGCYRMLDDYRKVPHTLEEFDFCNKDSQYYPVAKEYFEQYGHKNPYGD